MTYQLHKADYSENKKMEAHEQALTPERSDPPHERDFIVGIFGEIASFFKVIKGSRKSANAL